MSKFSSLFTLVNALVNYSSIVGDISGSIGNITFSKNGGGSYAKNKKVGVNPDTLKQQEVRGAFGSNAGRWRTFTPAQQQLWIDSTGNYPYTDRLGNSRTYSGSVLYTKLNQNLFVLGVSPISVPKIPVSLSNITVGEVDHGIDSRRNHYWYPRLFR